MPQKQKFRFEIARYVDLKFRRAIDAVELQFLTPQDEPFAVTIPLAHLGLLHRRTLRALEREPDLFVPESKKHRP